MRSTLAFLIIILAFCSCGQKGEQTETKSDNVAVDSMDNTASTKTSEKVTNNSTELTILEWQKQQDSIRNEILKTKKNQVLKKSFLQEMYIRNVASILRDTLFVTIPFDLHGADCAAPDCYSTDISFHFKLGDTLIFPQQVQFQEREHGCVKKITNLAGGFQLIEQTDRHVIYHSNKYKRTLVLFRSNKESGTFAYFFKEVDQHRINGENLYKIVKDYNEEDKNSIYPFTSWILSADYEKFLN